MGMDAVEIILRTEKLFVITINDDEAAAISTVGDFYQLICGKLDVIPLPFPITSDELPIITHTEHLTFFRRKYTHLLAPPEVLPWSPQSVWDTLVAVFVDQQGLKPHEILPHARIGPDLGID